MLSLRRLYHDDTPVQGATFEVEVENERTIVGTLDENGEAKVGLLGRPKRVRFGPDVRPYERADPKRNPDYKEQLTQADADALVHRCLRSA